MILTKTDNRTTVQEYKVVLAPDDWRLVNLLVRYDYRGTLIVAVKATGGSTLYVWQEGSDRIYVHDQHYGPVTQYPSRAPVHTIPVDTTRENAQHDVLRAAVFNMAANEWQED